MYILNIFIIYIGLILWLFNFYKLDESIVVFGVVMLVLEGNIYWLNFFRCKL